MCHESVGRKGTTPVVIGKFFIGLFGLIKTTQGGVQPRMMKASINGAARLKPESKKVI
jgi:hypothetical protein